MKSKIETITPALARGILGKNNKNRNVRATHVDFLSSEMANRRWKLTNASIALAPDGTVVDGQHRLLAVVQSGVSIQTWVTRDVPLEAQDVIDTGAKRTVADQLHRHGLANASLAVAAARQIAGLACYNGSVRLSVDATTAVLDEFRREVEFCIAAVGNFRPAKSGWAVGTLAFAMHGEPKAKAFIESLGNGENLARGNPAKTLRDWMLNSFGNGKALCARAKSEAVLNAAFNAVHGQSVTTVRRGVQGVAFFVGKNGRFVKEMRNQFHHQLAADPKATGEALASITSIKAAA